MVTDSALRASPNGWFASTGTNSFLAFDDTLQLGRHRRHRRIHGRQFQHGMNLLARVIGLAPGITAFGLGMAGKIKDRDFHFPGNLAGQHFIYRDRLDVSRIAFVRLPDEPPQSLDVFRAQHNVQFSSRRAPDARPGPAVRRSCPRSVSGAVAFGLRLLPLFQKSFDLRRIVMIALFQLAGVLGC